MGTIDEIINAIDKELIKKNKRYLLLGQANDLLVSEDIMSIDEKNNQKFKKILAENKLHHAYQTETKPRQWRIPLSAKGKKTLKKKEQLEHNQQNVIYTICPICGINLGVPYELANELVIKCLSCNNDIQNPLVFGSRFHNTKNYKSSESEYLKDQILKNVMYASIGIGFFFPPVWIVTIILFLIRLLK